MKNFVLYIAKIIVISFLTAFIIQFIADSGLKKIKNSIYQDWNKILNGNVNTDLVILGSSRGCVSYNPEVFKEVTGMSTFNLSFDAGAYNLQDIKYNIYLEKNIKPKVIIQNIDLTHFGVSKKLPEYFQFLPYMSNSLISNGFSGFDEYLTNYKYIPLLKYNQNKRFLVKGLTSFFGINHSMPQTKDGYISKNVKFKRDNHNLLRLKQSKYMGLKNTEGLKDVKSSIKKQASDNTTVFVVWAPEFKDRLFYSNPLSKNIKAEIKSLANNSNIYFLDLSNDSISVNSNYFYDTFHLNSLGSNLFSTKVADQINKILKNQ